MGTCYYENEDGEIAAKECTGCGEVRVIGDFSKHKVKLGGKQSKCKSCVRKYYQENKESIAENVRKYNQENKENARKYNQENKERIAERMRKYRQENKERIAECSRKYRQENKELFQINCARRRALKRQLPDDLTLEQRNATLGHFNNSCALTGDSDVHLDHVIPIDIGHGGTTSQNMIPLRADLNISKQARCIFDWFYDVKNHFNLPQTKFDELIEYLADINGMTADGYEDYVRGCHDNPRVIDETILDETGSAG